MTTVDFWTGFMIGASVNALLTIAFTWWQGRRDNDTTPRTNNTQEP